MLVPQTNIRLTVVQWIPNKGAYEKWDALGGDFQVSDSRTITVPVIGTVSVASLDTVGLSAMIARELKARIGLIQAPEVSVGIIDYPPIYVVGDVKMPGEYRFHEGLIVLQSLAMSGGVLRHDGETKVPQPELIGDLRGLDDSILRSEIRIARLQAEMSGAKTITYQPRESDDKQAADAIYRQEQAIFVARANLLARQSKSFAELRDLLSAEISDLDEKTKSADADVESVEQELRNVKSMVEKGIALPSRQADLERMLRSYYSGRLDLTTATMRARQGISEASRNLEGLYDRQRSDVVSELQNEQANLDQLKIKRETGQRKLLEALSRSPDTGPVDDDALVFTITRQNDGKAEELAAGENTPLHPGDVVRVTRKSSREPGEVENTTELPAADGHRSGLSQ
jgi:polysaccharide export outer membrane protein